MTNEIANQTIEIHDCPFCGAKSKDLNKTKSKGVYAYHNSPSSDIPTWYHVMCLECGGSAPNIAAWNFRKNQVLPKSKD